MAWPPPRAVPRLRAVPALLRSPSAVVILAPWSARTTTAVTTPRPGPPVIAGGRSCPGPRPLLAPPGRLRPRRPRSRP
eukprot:scaffold36763_cov45-Prasinocladus_malaysianus.AAC.2